MIRLLERAFILPESRLASRNLNLQRIAFRAMSSQPPRSTNHETLTQKGNIDYTDWTSERLINRVLELEKKLRDQVDNHQKSTSTPVTDPPLKEKPAPRPFDSSKYHTRKIALKFAYLGGSYNGLEYHANNKTPLPTVEEVLWKALMQTRLIAPEGSSEFVFERNEAGQDQPSEIVVNWEGCEYSKCGRTDRGVSAFGQVVSLRVRSARKKREAVDGQILLDDDDPNFDPVRDELPYIHMLNRVLPPTIRALAWCPSVPANFDARFSCREREYRYFFTSPAFLPLPGAKTGTEYLDIEAMREAASYLIGTHDFRNMCKIDPSKQITNFQRRVAHASIDFVSSLQDPRFPTLFNSDPNAQYAPQDGIGLYTFTVKGSAFLWHQVRCMVAILFLVGQRLEKPSVVKELLDIEACPARPKYDMASDKPLVLWNCKFSATHGKVEPGTEVAQPLWDRGEGDDELEWKYSNESGGQNDSKSSLWGRTGIMERLWTMWRESKMEEILESQLMDLVALHDLKPNEAAVRERQLSARVFQGDNTAPARGKYTPIMKMERNEPVDVVNARWVERKGLKVRSEPNSGTGDE